jgi:hypothetical protein
MQRISLCFCVALLLAGCACPAAPPYDPQTGQMTFPGIKGAAAPASSAQASHENAPAK